LGHIEDKISKFSLILSSLIFGYAASFNQAAFVLMAILLLSLSLSNRFKPFEFGLGHLEAKMSNLFLNTFFP
jgi:hypothetical protein